MRNRYLDFLRAAAIVRVIVYHLYGWPWLSIVLPAMGIMFALAGSLTAASLEKRAAKKVVISRLRRLLPPLWLLGLILVPAMIYLGWAREKGGIPFDLAHSWHLLFWLFPLGDPPGSIKLQDGWDPLWYIRAYVWFILLSPFMYAAYKKIGWFAVVAPLAAIVAIDRTGLTLPDTADTAMWDFVTFAACWMTGFAHHDGRLRRLSPATVFFAALVLGAIALYWQQGHQGPDKWDLNDVPESQALWSLAFVLIALRWEPSMAWLERVRPLDRLVSFLNARAVTIYLWHNLAITLIFPILAFAALDDLGHGLDAPADLLATFALTLVAVLAFGWVEDLAARRRPRFWPSGAAALHPSAALVPATAAAEAIPAVAATEVIPAVAAANQLPALPGPAGDGFGPAPALSDGSDFSDEPDFSGDRRAGWGSGVGSLPLYGNEGRAAVPPARRPVPWAAEVPAAAGAARDPGSGMAIAGRIRPMIAEVPTGRHAVGEPETAGTLDLGLPAAGFLDLEMPVAGRRPAPPRRSEGPLEGQIVDGPPSPRRPGLDDDLPEWFQDRRDDLGE